MPTGVRAWVGLEKKVISLFPVPSLFYRISLISPTCRIDAAFTKTLNTAVGVFSVYAILSSKSFLDELKAAETGKK
jgi:hypothetical protein